MENKIKITPREGKVIMDKRNRATYAEVVCSESDRRFFVEVDKE